MTSEIIPSEIFGSVTGNYREENSKEVYGKDNIQKNFGGIF